MPRSSSDTTFRYGGFPSPNGTVVPDDVFDVLMPELSEAELRVLLYVIRRTFGFKKNSDAISLSQMVDGVTTRDGRVLDRGTGMSRRGVMKGCAGLVEKGVVRVEKRLSEQGDNEINVYHLRFRGEPEPANERDRGVGHDVPYRRERGAPPVGNNVPPQQTELQQTEEHPSKIRMASPHVDMSDEEHGGGDRERARPVMVGTVAETLPLGEAIAQWQRRRQTQVATAAAPARRERGEAADQPASTRLATAPSVPRRGRLRQVPQQDEAYQVIQAYVADFAPELNDKAPLKVSTTRAYNLYKRSGLDQGAFVAQLYAARAIVKERTGSIRTRGEDSGAGLSVKHKAGYYFAVLEDLLGLRDEPATRTGRGKHPA